MAGVRKRPLRALLGSMTTVQKVAALIVTIGTAIGIVYAGGLFARSIAKDQFGEWPYAEKVVVDVMVGRTERSITSQQITRQIQIDILKSKCAVKCSEYERKALENILREWADEQKELDRLLKKSPSVR